MVSTVCVTDTDRQRRPSKPAGRQLTQPEFNLANFAHLAERQSHEFGIGYGFGLAVSGEYGRSANRTSSWNLQRHCHCHSDLLISRLAGCSPLRSGDSRWPLMRLAPRLTASRIASGRYLAPLIKGLLLDAKQGSLFKAN